MQVGRITHAKLVTEEMKDRLERIMPPRLVVPLIVLLLVGILWLTGLLGNSPTPPVETLPEDSPPAETCLAGRVVPPCLLPSEDSIDRLLPLDEGLSTVLAAEFLPRNRRPGRWGQPDDIRALGQSFGFGEPVNVPAPPVPPDFDENGQNNPQSDTPSRLCPTQPPASIEPVPAGRVPGLAGPSGESPKPQSDDQLEEQTEDPEEGLAESRPAQPPPGALLPSADVFAPRSERLERIAQEADRHSRRGFELAGRKAYFSARSEFVKALRLVAQGLDAEHGTNVHSRALSAGLTAIKETDDFIPRGSRLEADLDLPDIVGGHRTRVLHEANIENLTPLEVLQCYFAYAQEQLGTAVGREVAGSMALRGLGKLHITLAARGTRAIRTATPKAMTFFQAALLADPKNYMAANDLGVLLARSGRHQDAKTMLEHSLVSSPNPATLHNLAVVYEQLGRNDLAQQARARIQAMQKAQRGSAPGAEQASRRQVRWVTPQTFARSFAQTPTARQLSPARSPAPPRQGNSPGDSPEPGQARPTTQSRNAWQHLHDLIPMRQ